MRDRTASLRPHLETYRQTVELEFATEAAAAAAELVLLPLYGGAEWAVSSRWDDNILADAKMRDVLSAHGYRGTFYLNGTDQGYYGNDYGLHSGRGGGLDRELLRGGHTVGGHSWTHPMLSYCNQNRIFEEVMRVRCDREASCDRPITTYAFSFCNWVDPLHGEVIHADIADALLRAGYGHVANAAFVRGTALELPTSHLLPPDGRPIDEAVERLLADAAAREREPNLSFNMHVWYDTPEKWAQFESELERYGRRPGWWYCNQTEYAAYRLQFRHTTLEPERFGNLLRVALERPAPADLGDPVPLTCEVRGVPAEQVTWISAADSVVERLAQADGAARFHLGHRDGQLLPERIGWIANDDNHTQVTAGDESPDFAGLRGLLSFQDLRLWIELRNTTGAPLSDVRITYRTPVAWHEGVIVRRLGALPVGAVHEQRLGLNAARTDYRYHSGNSFFAAQIDFVQQGRAGRLYLTCRVPNSAGDASYPQGRLQRCGPLPAEAVDRALELAGDEQAEWLPEPPEQTALLDVEVVGTTGRWRAPEAQVWLLRGLVDSDVEQPAELRLGGSVVAVWLNGEPARGEVVLRHGPNTLLLACRVDTQFRPENAGVFIRLAEPGTGYRLTNVRYRAE